MCGGQSESLVFFSFNTMLLTLTKPMQDLLKSALEDPDFCPKFRDEAQIAVEASLDQKNGVSLGLLRESCSYLSKQQPALGQVWFHELVRGTSVYIEPKPEEDPEIKAEREAALEKLRFEQSNREYADMVASVITSENQKYALGVKPGELKQIQGHIVTILNIGLSMAAVFTAIYMGSRTMTNELGVRILLSLAGAILIALVETALYLRYAERVLAPPKKTKSKIA
ncbi:endoplasmic reticulum-based factor for assembly of V-ATPase-domain-containing protein [Fennellomyces sp. T-0311]|nr:endoplasmic reticulum-based factor for assembly of V-ATPase-domain-containing protein [Fennellomyces sp. T-0311]